MPRRRDQGSGVSATDRGGLGLLPGDLVRLRDRTWRVAARRHQDEVTALALTGLEADNRHDARTVLAPFEHIMPVGCSTRPQRVTLGRWLRGLVALGLNDGPYELPRAAVLARVALLPYQLAPALAILNGHASRVLVADEVGLGKTIQAAILLRELTDRGLVRRALIVVPASLREQWQSELATRVDIRAELCDASWATRVGRTLPPDANPWQLPHVCLVSHDYVKQPELLNAVAACSWDLLIIDEAHTLTPPTWRAEAGQRLGHAARWLVLLTATPHRGDETAFRALCETGRLGRDDVLALFRRTREDVGLPRARVTRLLRVRPSMAEVRLHAELTRYAARVWAEPSVTAGARLATVVLTKRALSSASALARSLQRRLDLLEAEPDHLDAEQLALPLDVTAEPPCPEDDLSDVELRAPGLFDRRLERRWLAALSTLAMRAQRTEQKRAALMRLVRRTREPVVVFTEYRDTLVMLVHALARVASVATLHGAQAPEERREALARFGDGRAMVLVATDAACEGLNLHARCRFVIVYELPWNPNRLEQRVGRVDRLGQTRRVHVVELVLSGSREDIVLARLSARRSRIAAALDPGRDRSMGTPLQTAMVVGYQGDIADRLDGELGGGSSEAVDSMRVLTSRDQADPSDAPVDGSLVHSRLDLDEESRRASVDLQRLRQLTALWGRTMSHDHTTRVREADLSCLAAHIHRRAPWVAGLDSRDQVTRRGMRKTGAALALVFATELQDVSGRSLVSIPTVLLAPCSPLCDRVSAVRLPFKGRTSVAVMQLLEHLATSPELRTRVAAVTKASVAAAREADQRLLARLHEREARIHEARARLARAHIPDLFGRPHPHLVQYAEARAAPGGGALSSAPDETPYVTRVSLQLALLLPRFLIPDS
ncbi:MAG: hypothetical protein GEU99_15080 [Luteitalea sp.]|nr:hypothetical protein [Luteitalea sp.]